jgi:hypothetical protein
MIGMGLNATPIASGARVPQLIGVLGYGWR